MPSRCSEPSIRNGKVPFAVLVRRLAAGRFEYFDKILRGTVAATPGDVFHQDFLPHRFQSALHPFVLDVFGIALSHRSLEQAASPRVRRIGQAYRKWLYRVCAPQKADNCQSRTTSLPGPELCRCETGEWMPAREAGRAWPAPRTKSGYGKAVLFWTGAPASFKGSGAPSKFCKNVLTKRKVFAIIYLVAERHGDNFRV